MLLTAIMYALVATALMQTTTPRFFVATTFSLVTLLHDYVSVGLVGLEYYGSAALADLLIITIITGVEPSKTALRLCEVCLVSIIVNGLGWLAWFFYLPPSLYNITFLFIYVWVMFIITRKDKEDVGGNSVLKRRFNLRGHFGAGR